MFQQVYDKYKQAGQEHVFTFYNSLDSSSQEKLLNVCKNIDIERVNRIFTKSTSSNNQDKKDVLSPLPDEAFDSLLTADPSKIHEWEKIGMELIAKNHVAVILLAGGQGTRLGSSAPKGCYDIQLPSKKSLFQLQGERIQRLQVLATQFSKSSTKVRIPWYIMTSGPTRAPTESFFIENNYFGLDKNQIIFFEQGVLPAFTPDGKIFMETKDTLALAPDGNGGIYGIIYTSLLMSM